MALSIAVDPCIDMDKVSDKAWNGALEENSVSEENMLTADLTLVLMAHHWKIDQYESGFSAQMKPRKRSCYP